MSDFWSRTLGAAPAVAASGSPGPVLPLAAPYTPYSPPTSPVNHKARSSLSTARCPDCASGNYSGDTVHMTRCYDCGYNPRFGIQAGASGGLPAGQGGPATPARQVSTSNNYQPNTVIGRIGA